MELMGLGVMTVAILMYGVIPLFADFNASHATNPAWTPHARFHVVTQVLTTSAIAAVALVLLWSPSDNSALMVCIAVIISSCVLGSFFASTLCKSFYGGQLSDKPKRPRLDANLANFATSAVLLIAGRMMVLAGS